MIAFIDDHREVYGVEPICKVFMRSLGIELVHEGVSSGAQLRSSSSLSGAR
jgi:hypothetical protein